MTAGQGGFSAAADAAALDVLADRLAVQELDRGAVHVTQLRTVLQLHALYTAAGMDIVTVSHAALALGCSEHRAGRLLSDGLTLGSLPGALEAAECGLLTIEQSSTVVQQLAPLPLPTRLQVWARLQTRLLLEADRGSVLPPARLTELLRRWVIAADPAEAEQRHKQAEAGRRVEYRRRADGLADLFAFGLNGPDAQAILWRVRERSHPVGADDDRTADQRRLDAFRDLLLGRDPLPLHDRHDGPHDTAPGGGRAGCGCWPGSPVPCGAQVLVHVTLDTALGRSDTPADLVGHGPLEPDLLTDLLLAAPQLRAVWTGKDGVPVAVGDRVLVPDRGDATSLREALLRMATQPPPPDLLHPTHPHDHPPDTAPPPGGVVPPGQPSSGRPANGERPPAPPSPSLPVPSPPETSWPEATAPGSTLPAGKDGFVPAAVSGQHPGGSGSYGVPRRLRRLLDVRAPRCEWPGCGARAVRCDAEHDRAWPAGATCACNLGPCCRRHHRIKQHGWTKKRGTGAAVTWMSPSGARSWLSPAQHDTPTPPARRLPTVCGDDPLAELSPLQQDEARWWLADCPDDPDGLELRAAEPYEEPGAQDRLQALMHSGDTCWSLDLDDPYAWA